MEHAKDHLFALFSACQLGDRAAFAKLYQLTAARLNGIAYRITNNRESANEVLQEAFIQIWQHKQEYQAMKGEVFTWLASIVRYRAYDKVRAEQRRHQYDSVEFNELDTHSPWQKLLNTEDQVHTSQALEHCLDNLEKSQKQSILMAYLYGYSREEISKHFNSPVNTIKSWLKRGLGRLQLCLNS